MQTTTESSPNNKAVTQNLPQSLSIQPSNLKNISQPSLDKAFPNGMLSITPSNQNSHSQQQNKDWKAKLSAKICEKAGINYDFADSIQTQIDRYIQSNPKKFQAEQLPIATLKIPLIQETFFELLPTFLMNELKSKLKLELERIRKYFEEKMDVDYLINCIIDELMQDPGNFQGYSFYFSSSDQEDISKFLQKDPSYLTHLELWKSADYQRQMEYCSGKSLKDIEIEKLRNPMRQIHSIVLRHKRIIDKVFNEISTKEEDFSQSKLQNLIIRLKKEIEILYCCYFKGSETISKLLSIEKLREVQSKLTIVIENFIREDFHDLDPHRREIISRVIEIKIKLGSKLIKSEGNYLKKRIEICGEDHKESKNQLAEKSALEKEYSKALEQKYKDSYYFKIADVAIDKIGASPLVKTELLECLPRFCEKKILSLRNENNISLTRNQLIELDKYLSELLQLKKLMSPSEYDLTYRRNKVRGKVAEKLAISPSIRVEDINQKMVETILASKTQMLEQFRGEFTNKDFDLLKKFLEEDKTCKRYFEALEGKGASSFLFKGKLNPYDLVRSAQLEDVEERVKDNQNSDQKRKNCLEKLKNYDSMPECAEKYLARLVVVVELAQIDETMIKTLKFETEFENLKKCLDTEGLSSGQLSEPIKEVQKRIDKEDWEQAKNCFIQTFKKIRELDFKLIIDLVKEAENTSESLTKKPVLAFIGKTGSGKSTSIHFLAGSKMTLTQVEGLNHIQVDAREGLKKVTTSPYAVSETRNVTPVTIEDAELSKFWSDYNGNNEIILCDMPGFGDTKSMEMDIANTLAVVTALKKAEKVRPIVVIGYKSLGDRSQGLRELGDQLARLQTNPNFKSFAYLFTQFPEKEKQNLAAMLKNLKTISQEDGADKVFIDFLSDMLKKTQSNEGSILFNPLEDEREDVIESLSQVDPIEYPQDFFKISFTNTSKHCLEKQLVLHKKKILAAVERNDFSYACYLLDELDELHKLLNYEPIREAYREIVGDLHQRFKMQYEKAKKALNTHFSSQNELLESDIQQYQTAMNIVKLAATLVNKHLNQDGAINEAVYEKNIQIQAMNLVSDIQKKSLEKSNLMFIKASLQKLNMVAHTLGRIQDQIDSACKDLKDKFNQAREKLNQSMENLKYENFASEFSQVRGAFDHLRAFLNIPESQIEEDKLKFLTMIKEDAASSEAAAKVGRIEKSDVLTQKGFLDRIQILTSSHDIKDCLNFDELKRIKAEFLEKICSAFDYRNNSIVNKLFNNNSASEFEIEEQYIQEMIWIREIPLAEGKTRDSYNKTMGAIIEKIQDLSGEITEILVQKVAQDYVKIAANLTKLEKIKWIDKYMQRSTCQVYLEKAEKSIMVHLEEQQIFIKNNSKFHPDNYSNNVKALQDVCRLKEFKNHVSIKEIQDIISQVEEECKKNIVASLVNTGQVIAMSEDNPFIDPIEMEARYGYVELCAPIGLLPESQVSKYFEPLKKYLTDNYGIKMQNEISGSFKEIKIGEEKTLNTHIQNISRRLQELEEYKNTRPSIYSCLKKCKITEKFIEELSFYRDELNDDLMDLIQKNDNHSIVRNLNVARALKEFDTYLNKKEFSVLYNQQKELFYTHIKKIHEEAKTALQEGDYSGLADLLQSLNVPQDSTISQYLKEIRKCLNKHAEQIFADAEEQIINLDGDLPLQEVRLIAQKFKTIEKLQSELKMFLDKPQQLNPNELSKFLIKLFSSYLTKLTKFKKAYNFLEFDRRLDHILLVVRALGKWCSEQMRKEVEELSNNRDDMLQEAAEKYLKLELDQYTFGSSPKEIIGNLTKANEINPIYHGAISLLWKDVLWKFKKTLKTEKEACFRKYEEALHFLPDDLRDILKAELREFKDNS